MPRIFSSIKRRMSRRRSKRRSSIDPTVFEQFQVDSVWVQVSPMQERLFQSCLMLDVFAPVRTLVGRHRETNEWRLCRIHTYDVMDGTFALVFEDGSLQSSTPFDDMKLPSLELSQQIEDRLKTVARASGTRSDVVASQESQAHVETLNGVNVWQAARSGDLVTVLGLVDGSNNVSPNDVEPLGSVERLQGRQGRTPLYLACVGGHVEMVRELVARGGVDADGSIYLAVVGREQEAQRVDHVLDDLYERTNTDRDYFSARMTDGIPEPLTELTLDDSALIRAMLAASSAATFRNEESMRNKLPRKLYHATDEAYGDECVVCLENKPSLAIAVPCGHISACRDCLENLREREGCPICRARILTTVAHRC